MILLGTGALISLGVLCCSCSTRPGVSGPRARRPSKLPAILATLLALLLTALGSYVYWETGVRGTSTAAGQLDRAIADAAAASGEGERLQRAGDLMLSGLDAIAPSCPPGTAAQVQKEVAPVKRQALACKSQADRYYASVQHLPAQLHDARAVGGSFVEIVGAGLLLPTAIVLLCCCTVLTTVCCSRQARCGPCCVRCMGPLLLAPAVLLAALAAAAQLEVGIVLGSFCLDVDANAVAYVRHVAGPNSTAYALSHYYIDGKGENPLLQELGRAEAEVLSVNISVSRWGAQVAQACPDWAGPGDLLAAIEAAERGIQTGRALLSEHNVYPFYDEAVHKDACTTAVIGLGWLVLLQVSAAFLSLPCLVATATGYLKALMQQRRARATALLVASGAEMALAMP